MVLTLLSNPLKNLTNATRDARRGPVGAPATREKEAQSPRSQRDARLNETEASSCAQVALSLCHVESASACKRWIGNPWN